MMTPPTGAVDSKPAFSARPGRSTESVRPVPTVALVGIHGHGVSHLRNARELHEQGRCRLIAVADPRPPEPGSVDGSTLVFPDLPALLGACAPEVVVLCTPIHTHAGLAQLAMEAGADVLLEKPPTPTLPEFEHLLRVSDATGRACQVGFQTLGSEAVAGLADAIADGRLGEVRSIAVRCTWVRTEQYFKRSRWAGKRVLDGVSVMDGVLTNPFAHAVATALRLDGSTTVADVVSVEAETFHANDIESDDTSVARIRTARGSTLVVAATLCASVSTMPEIEVRGTRATAVLCYTTDDIAIRFEPWQEPWRPGPAVPLAGRHGRSNLLANLIAHRVDPTVELIAEIRSTGAFTAVLEALRLAPAPRPIAAEHVRWETDDSGRHVVVPFVREWVRLATERGRTFSELGAPWATSDGAQALDPAGVRLSVGDTVVATYDPGFGVVPTSSPRPFLHPVRTLGGFVVTDAHPDDHDWHLGVGIAVQDVAGCNLWGGRTYLPDRGYQWRDDHGRMEHVAWLRRGADHLVQRLRWVDPGGADLLHEIREMRWRALSLANAWELDLSFSLTAPGTDPVPLGSPGSNGRPNAGYGGFFWRLPRNDGMTVRSANATGEQATHGGTARWLCVGLRTGDRDATILLRPADEITAEDRWFVRSQGYPGVGSSLAWDAPVLVRPGRPLRRRFRAVIADGAVDPAVLLAASPPAWTDGAG